MKELIYPGERRLATITLTLGLIVWIALIAGTFGGVLLVLLIGFILYLFTQSALISHIKGNGIELSVNQFPDLHEQFVACCDTLQIKQPPEAYVLNGNGGLNAFATRFLSTQYVVLMSDVVDAMDEHEDGVRFYIGHELGHLKRKHLRGHFFRWPVLWLPLLGAAYSRACESTCDLHGLACSSSPENAARALSALSTGVIRWKQLDIPAYLEQLKHTGGFWMSFHELITGYPWLSKRVARVLEQQAAIPKRNTMAYIPAIVVPYAGRLGGGFGLIILVYIIGVLAAIAIPAYQDFNAVAITSRAIEQSREARDMLAGYYETRQEVPDSLSTAGIDPAQAGEDAMWDLDPENMVFSIYTPQGEIIFTPSVDDQGRVYWECGNGAGLTLEQLPESCQNTRTE